jgi:hypothetical protein
LDNMDSQFGSLLREMKYTIAFVIFANVAALAIGVAVVVWVLRYMGVIA